MFGKNNIADYFTEFDFDIRKSKNGRWIDQKCTPDVLSTIADCIINFIAENPFVIEFTKNDIWFSQYTKDFIGDIFNKPDIDHRLSQNEYDKLFSQPLEMLASANVLHKEKKGRGNFYSIRSEELLEYISLREKNALAFIIIYCKKVIWDSDIWPLFERFFDVQTKDAYLELKDGYENFMIANTKINGCTEVRRIFTKVLNPLAYDRRKRGTAGGYISDSIITYAELMYNRVNFRDINASKPKDMTRNEWNNQRSSKINKQYYLYQSEKAKRFLRRFNDDINSGRSELMDEYSQGNATQIHHIFSAHQYPEISMCLENLIALTPTQHLTMAHPDNNTHRIDLVYQEKLLKAKVGSIKRNLSDEKVESIYQFSKFIEVLSNGFDADYEVGEYDFCTIMQIIADYYMESG